MKTSTTLLGMALMLTGMMMGNEALAQRHNDGRQNNRRDERHDDRQHSGNDHHQDYNHHQQNHYGQHHRVVRPVVYHYRAPRYVYYRDYNTYYDCHRGVFIIPSGRGWMVSAVRPVMLRRVDLNYAYHTDVDYYDDDLPHYLGRR